MLCAVQPCSLVEPSVRDADAGQGSRRGEGRRGGWEVQLVEGGSAGAGEEVCVRRGLWKQHRPIIMGSMGDNLLSIEPGTLARALHSGGAAQADVLGVPAADGGGCAGGGCSGCKVCKVGAGCAGDGCSGTGCRACADAAGGAGSSRLFFFAYSVAQTAAKRRCMIEKYKKEEEEEKKKMLKDKEGGLGAAVAEGRLDP